MRRYTLGSVAIMAALSLTLISSAYSKNYAGTWYMYSLGGLQNPVLRESATSYTKITGDPGCTGSSGECAVQIRFGTGQNPNFALVSFTFDGYPIVDGVYVLANEELDE